MMTNLMLRIRTSPRWLILQTWCPLSSLTSRSGEASKDTIQRWHNSFFNYSHILCFILTLCCPDINAHKKFFQDQDQENSKGRRNIELFKSINWCFIWTFCYLEYLNPNCSKSRLEKVSKDGIQSLGYREKKTLSNVQPIIRFIIFLILL